MTDIPDPKKDKYLNELANRFGLMALFAHVAYRKDLPEKERETACEYIDDKKDKEEKEDTNLLTDGMPYVDSPDKPDRWSRWRGSDEIKSTPCYNKKGLFYETYVYPSTGTIQEAVIAFRGTENYGTQIWYDWKTNLENFFGFEPEQYKIAFENIPDVIRALKHNNKGIKIYATGHSLGGGLAQQAGYLSRDIEEVFTFNTNPVTNWTNLSLKKKVKNAYPIIHRIYHG